MSERETLVQELVNSGVGAEICLFVARSIGIEALSEEALRRAVEIVRTLKNLEAEKC